MGAVAAWSQRTERRAQRRAQALSRAVSALPAAARRAMLDAVEAEQLIVGGYTDRRGRMCPMLAVHRCGVRTDVGSFPHAWDAFAGARRPRPATPWELGILRTLLQEALPASDRPGIPATPLPGEVVASTAVGPPVGHEDGHSPV